MKLKHFFALSVLVLGASSLANAAFVQCPPTGGTTGCNALLTVNADSSITVSVDATQPPYDGSEDSIVGVVNNTGAILQSLALSGSDIFGLDGDGMCDSSISPNPAGNCKLGLSLGDPYDYTGDFVTFAITDGDHGVVTFIGGLAPGASTYFSLENSPDSLELVGSSPVTSPAPTAPAATPEPASFLLLAGGLSALALAKRR